MLTFQFTTPTGKKLVSGLEKSAASALSSSTHKKAGSSLQQRQYTLAATPQQRRAPINEDRKARFQREAQESRQRFEEGVDRLGSVKPELSRLIDEFTTTFLEFAHFEDIGNCFHDPLYAQVLIGRYTRPLKPLEYYFTDSQLTSILDQRAHNELLTEFPSKADLLEHIRSDAFMEMLVQKHGSEEAKRRQDAHYEFVEQRLDDRLQVRPLRSITQLLESTALGKASVDEPLEDAIARLQEEGLLNSGDTRAIAKAINTSDLIPGATEFESTESALLQEMDRLILQMTPSPNSSAPLSYYERLRLEGKDLTRRSRTLPSASAAATTDSNATNTMSQSNDLPEVYPFTVRQGYIGSGLFVNPIQHIQNIQDKREALQEASEITPAIRHWTTGQIQQLNSFIDYTNEWMSANKMIPSDSVTQSSGIEWTERKLPSLTPADARQHFSDLLHRTPPTTSGTQFNAPADALRAAAQQLLTGSVVSSDSFEALVQQLINESSSSSSSTESQDEEALFDASTAVLSRLLAGSSTAGHKHPQHFQRYSPDSSRKLASQIADSIHKVEPYRRASESLASAYGVSLKDFDHIKCGEERTQNYAIEATNAWEAVHPQSSSTFVVRSPIVRLTQDELSAHMKLCWLMLRHIAECEVEKLVMLAYQGSANTPVLENVWEAKKLAKHIVDATEELYNDPLIPASRLERVAGKLALDYGHLHAFIAGNLQLLGMAPSAASSPAFTINASTDTNILRGVLMGGKLTKERKEEILNVMAKVHLDSASNAPNSTLDLLNGIESAQLSQIGDIKTVDTPVKRRLAKMDPSIVQLVESLNGAELRSIFPLDVIFFHPFITLEQRSNALTPVAMADEALASKISSSGSLTQALIPATSSQSSARTNYLLSDLPQQILKHLRSRSLLTSNSEGKLSSFGTEIERIAQLLELPPVGISLSSNELHDALRSASESPEADTLVKEEIASLLPALSLPAVIKLFSRSVANKSQGEVMLDDATISAKMESLLQNGLPSDLNRDSLAYRSLSAEIDTYKNAKRAREVKKAAIVRESSQRVAHPELVQTLKSRLQPLLGLVRPEARSLIEPLEADSFDALLLKQDMIARLEEKHASYSPVTALLKKLPEGQDGDFVITNADGSTTVKSREDLEKELEDEKNNAEAQGSKPKTSALFGSTGSSDSSSNDVLEGILPQETLEAQREALTDELDTISDMLGIPRRPLHEQSIDRVKEMMKAWISEVSGMDVLQIWEKYPELAPPIPAQATHGPAREIFDLLTPIRSTIPSAARHMYRPMKESVTAWYLDRQSETNVPRHFKPMDETSSMAFQNALEHQSSAEEFLKAYIVDLAHPTKYVQLFHDAMKFSPRLFRTLDFDRDMDTLKAYESTADILKLNDTVEERIEWYKQFQIQIAHYADVVRSLIGDDGERYLKYNDALIQRWLAAYDRDRHGPVSPYEITRIKEAVLDSGELDNPDERVVLYTINLILKLSLDATELERLKEIHTEIDFERWHIWRIRRKLRHQEDLWSKPPPTKEENANSLRNIELPQGHPDKKYSVDYYDAQDDMMMRKRLAETLHHEKFESSSPDWEEIYKGKVSSSSSGGLAGAGQMADDAASELSKQLEEQKNAEHYRQKAEERCMGERIAHNLSPEREDRLLDISKVLNHFIIQHLVSSGLSVTDTSNWEVARKHVLASPNWPHLIGIDPIFTDMQTESRESAANSSQTEASVNKPLSTHDTYTQSRAVAQSPAQVFRIESCLRQEPWTSHLPIPVLRQVADIIFAEKETARLTVLEPEFAILPSNLSLDQAQVIVFLGLRIPSEVPIEDDMIMKLAQKAIAEDPKILQTSVRSTDPMASIRASIAQFQLLDESEASEKKMKALFDHIEAIDVRAKFPLVDFDYIPGSDSPSALPPSAAAIDPILSTPAHDIGVVHDTTAADHIHAQRTPAPRFAEVDVFTAFQSSVSALKDSLKLDEDEIAASIAANKNGPTPAESEAWSVAYKLFAHAAVLEHVLVKEGAAEGAGGLNSQGASFASTAGLDRVEGEFYRLLYQALEQGVPAPDAAVSPTRLIPWTLIQKMLGYSDRQLKTLILFLANKNHYLEDAKSRPPKIDGFYWELSEFKAIRNHFLGVPMHPSGLHTREERIFNLLFTEPSSDALAVLAKRAQSTHDSQTSRRSSHIQNTSSRYAFEPVKPYTGHGYSADPEVIPGTEIPASKMDRLAFAQQEAAKHPLDGTTKYTAGQAALIAKGMDPALFAPAQNLRGLDSLIPLPSAISSSSDIDEIISHMKKVSSLYKPTEEQLKEAQSPPAPLSADGVTSVRFLPYASHERINLEEEHREVLDPSAVPKKEESVQEAGEKSSPAAEGDSATSESKDGADTKKANGEEDTTKEKAEGDEKKTEGEETPVDDEDDETKKAINWAKLQQDYHIQEIAEARSKVAKESQIFNFTEDSTSNDLPLPDPYDPFHAQRERKFLESRGGADAPEYFMDELDIEHLIGQRRQLQRLLQIKSELLKKQMRLLDIKDSFPAAYECVETLYHSWNISLDLTFWKAAPHQFQDRATLSEMTLQHWTLSSKFTRRLQVDLAPIIWGHKSFIPKDSFGETVIGLTLGESIFTKYESDAVLVSPDGQNVWKPDFHFRELADPEEKLLWAAKREEWEAGMEARNPFNKKRLSIMGVLAVLAVIAGAGSIVYAYINQDEDTLPQRVSTEATILKTRLAAAADRVGVGALTLGSLFLKAFTGFGWLFTDTRFAQSALAMDDFVRFAPMSPRELPGYLVRPETGGYHYDDWLNAGMAEKFAREQALISDAVSLYERRSRDPELQSQIKAQKAKIDDAIRLAQLRQYEKQKRDFANAVVKEAELPEMPDWFEMPENRFWDAPSEFRFIPPTAENFWRRSNWAYHPDDKAPEVRMLAPGEALFHHDAQISTEGLVQKHPFKPWRSRHAPQSAVYEENISSLNSAVQAQRRGSL